MIDEDFWAVGGAAYRNMEMEDRNESQVGVPGLFAFLENCQTSEVLVNSEYNSGDMICDIVAVSFDFDSLI